MFPGSDGAPSLDCFFGVLLQVPDAAAREKARAVRRNLAKAAQSPDGRPVWSDHRIRISHSAKQSVIRRRQRQLQLPVTEGSPQMFDVMGVPVNGADFDCPWEDLLDRARPAPAPLALIV